MIGIGALKGRTREAKYAATDALRDNAWIMFDRSRRKLRMRSQT
jgi:hypothetical protein